MRLETYQRTFKNLESVQPELVVQFAPRGMTHVTRLKILGTDDEVPIDQAFAAKLLGASYKECPNINTSPLSATLATDTGSKYVYRKTYGDPEGKPRCVCGVCGYGMSVEPGWTMRHLAHPPGFKAIQGKNLDTSSRANLPVSGLGWWEQKIVEDQIDGRLILAFSGFWRVTEKLITANFPAAKLRYMPEDSAFAVAAEASRNQTK